ncbi:uncharacterized protein BX664DRAFT_342997 [Halteromyces radiatus]|uniref:uncharacterized protein n=1 Tax=Halteromyces radiatus TaxID=101107 RepID=UPI00222052E0|nr:uncharacterized protein BX664DRAFT_342997 [Halteromyces radiatus]KAI8078889.1 hypothetical protein BX664DRAFT_342997 [Halteromyces radiatus]
MGFIGDPDIPQGHIEYKYLLHQWANDPFWIGNINQRIRYLHISGGLPPYRFPRTMIQQFWVAPMHPEARTVWYKVLIQKIPLQKCVSRFRPPTSSLCVLCHQEETIEHFVYSCPLKKTIWDTTLAVNLPLYFLQPVDFCDFILHLRLPPNTTIHSTLFTSCATTIHQIWCAHWKFKLENKPFHEHPIVRMINTRIASIHPPPPHSVVIDY